MVGSQSIAKLSPPQLHRGYESPRLLARLQELLRCRAVWVCGSAGAGKTTLVGSYLRRKKVPCLWYQVDVGDLDPANTFYYLGLAAEKAAAAPLLLPLLTPEYQPGLEIFARRFFEALYQALPRPFVLVFDDCQEAAAEGPFPLILQTALATLPEGVSAIFTSRDSPPLTLSGLRGAGQLGVFHSEELRLTREEALGLFRKDSMPSLTPETVARIHKQTQGWAGGMILLAEEVRRSGEAPGGQPSSFSEEIFDYFAGELFQHLEAETRDFLLRTSLLPAMTVPMAKALSGNDGAGKILARLCRQHFFTEKHAGHYRYHPLFRGFLLARAAEDLAPAILNRLRLQAAQLLEEWGNLEDAVPLLLATGEYDRLTGLIGRHVQELLAQGRYRLLAEWLGGLPAEVLAGHPWLAYWLGVGCQALVPERSRKVFEVALDCFMTRRDLVGAVMAWVGIIDSYRYEWNDFTPLDRWITWLEEVLPALPSLPAPDLEARLAGAIALALTIRRPDSPDLDAWLEKSLDLARASRDFPLKLQIFNQALFYYGWSGDLDKARLLLEEIRPFGASAEASPLHRLSWRWFDAVIDIWAEGASPKALAKVTTALEFGNEHGVLVWHHMLNSLGVYLELSVGDLEGAEPFLAALEASLDPRRQHMYCQYHYLLAWRDYLRGEDAAARAQAEIALTLAEDTGYLFPEILSRLELARVLRRQRDHEGCRRQLALALEQSRRSRSAPLTFACLLEEAEIAFECGHEGDGVVLLRQAFRLGGSKGFMAPPWWWDGTAMGRVCARALEYGIEPECVRRFVQQRQLALGPGPGYLEEWPWPVRIYALGTFRVEVEGRPLEFAGKVQKKPLELLTVLLALGGREVEGDRLADLLWPEAEGDAAQKSFATNLHRLRQLVGYEGALPLRQGRLSLNPACCWSDVGAFLTLVEEQDAFADGEGPAVVRPDRLERAFRLYRGPFLPRDLSQPWVLRRREQLRQKFVRLVRQLGVLRRQQGDSVGALRCFEQGLEADATAEELYHQIILCHLEDGRLAEAVRTFRECERALTTLLGVPPSADTAALVRHLTA